MHPWPSGHFAQSGPPQSTPVSFPSFFPLQQCAWSPPGPHGPLDELVLLDALVLLDDAPPPDEPALLDDAPLPEEPLDVEAPPLPVEPALEAEVVALPPVPGGARPPVCSAQAPARVKEAAASQAKLGK
jgi:hypothetical protein